MPEPIRSHRMPAPLPEHRIMRLFRRVGLVLVWAQIFLFAWGITRRIWQVWRVEVAVSSAELAPGTVVSIDVITTGEVRNRILLELVQGPRTLTLLDMRGRLSAINTYDPRVFRYRQAITLTAGQLASFTTGPVIVRLTAFGGQKLLRTPAPRVRELSFQPSPPSATSAGPRA